MATAPGWPTTSRSTTSPSSVRQRSTRTFAIRPLQTSSTPMRSNAIDLLCESLSTCQRGPEEQLVLIERAAHRRHRQAGPSITLEVDGELGALVLPGQRFGALGQ